MELREINELFFKKHAEPDPFSVIFGVYLGEVIYPTSVCVDKHPMTFRICISIGGRCAGQMFWALEGDIEEFTHEIV